MRKKTRKNFKSGFTLVELSIAIVFIAIMFLAIGTTTSGIITAYKKGVSLKLVNSSAHDLIDEFSAAVQESPSIDPTILCAQYFNPNGDTADERDSYSECVKDDAYHLIYQQWNAEIAINGEDRQSRPIFGAFCTGKYSYVWNTGYTFSGLNSQYTIVDSTGNEVAAPSIDNVFDQTDHLRLAKFTDPNFSVCALPIHSSGVRTKTYTDLASGTVVSENPYGDLSTLDGAELIAKSTTPLALYDLVIFHPARDPHTKRLFYSASMIVATISGGINISSSSHFCSPPAKLELKSDFSYCAINKFNFAMRATGD